MFLQIIEWAAALLIGLSILWYPALSGWKRRAAPILGSVGAVGFCIVALNSHLYGVAVLNGTLGFVNLWNLWKEIR